MKYYLLQNGCRGIFLECVIDENGNSSALSDESVRFITERLFDYIELKYSIQKWDEVEGVCKAACTLFPSIELVKNLKIK